MGSSDRGAQDPYQQVFSLAGLDGQPGLAHQQPESSYDERAEEDWPNPSGCIGVRENCQLDLVQLLTSKANDVAVLRMLELDPEEQVRSAARASIGRIESTVAEPPAVLDTAATTASLSAVTTAHRL